MNKKQGLLVAGIALVMGAGSLGWLANPRPLAACIADQVQADQATDKDNAELVALGERAEREGQKQAAFSRTDYFSCTRYRAFALDFPPKALQAEAYTLLRSAPSFDYGRHRVLTLKEAPNLGPQELQASARLMRAATALSEGLRQAQACPDLAKADATALHDYEQLAEPYLTGIVWNMGLVKSAAEAQSSARTILESTLPDTESPGCADARFATELKTLRAFKAGQLAGLPCSVTMVEGEPELSCK